MEDAMVVPLAVQLAWKTNLACLAGQLSRFRALIALVARVKSTRKALFV